MALGWLACNLTRAWTPSVRYSALGERLIFSKLTVAELPELLGSAVFTRRVLRLFWHMVSVAWWGFAFLLVLLSATPVSGDNQRLIWAMTLIFLTSAVLAFVLSRGRHFSWEVLLIIAVLIWLGGR